MSDGAEAVVLIHELGHSIGVGGFKMDDATVYEVYDKDLYSVMSFLKIYNAGFYWSWYYSRRYWNTKNLEHYAI